MANTKSLDLELSSSQYAYISDGDQTGLDITGDISVEAWIKLEQLPSAITNVFTLLAKEDGTNRSYDAFINPDNKIWFIFFSGSAVYSRAYTTTALTSADVGEWIHIAITADVSEKASGIKIYKNGVAETMTGSTNNATSIQNSSAMVSIGARSDESQYFDGLLDEVRVWNDIRTATEISDNYQKELDGDESGLVGYWKFNDSALDETSNDNDLTLVNTPSYSSDVPSWATAYSLVCATGAFVLTGYPATFKRAYTLACAVGTFVLTGFDTAFNKGRTMVCETGAFILTGYDTIFKRTISLVCATGTFALTGFDATFQKAMKLVCSTGRFILTGYNVLFKSTGWNNDTKPTSSWTEDTKPTSSWTNEDK